MNNTVEPTDTFSQLRAFAVERLPIQACGTHGLLCYGIRSTIDRLAKVLHRRGALDDIGSGVEQILRLPKWQSLVELVLGRSFFNVFHPGVLSPLEIGAVITAWSRALTEISGQTGQRELLKIAAPLALFPPVPLEEEVTRAWLAAVETFDRGERRGLIRAIPALHYASASVYMQLARDDDALAALAETPPQAFSVREEVFRRLRGRLLDDPVVASKALRAGWVPSSARERWIRRIAGELTRDRLDLRARGELALELVHDLGDEDSEHLGIVEVAAQRARSGLSGVAAARLVEAATRLPYARELLIEATIAGGTRRLMDAFDLSNRADPQFRARIGDAAALRVVATNSGPDALAALRRLETTPAVRQQLLAAALSHSEAASDVKFLIELLGVDVPAERRANIGTRCVRELGAAGAPWLGQLAAVLAGDPAALESVRAAAIEAAHASGSAPFVLGVLEHFTPADASVRDELAMRAVRLVAASREREHLERLLKSVAPTSPAYEAAVNQAVEWHPRHPAAAKRRDSECRARQRVRSSEREELLRAVGEASPLQRLRWIYQHRRNMYYWPTAWADVDDSVIEALAAEEREALAVRLSHGPREWRALARRIRGT